MSASARYGASEANTAPEEFEVPGARAWLTGSASDFTVPISPLRKSFAAITFFSLLFSLQLAAETIDPAENGSQHVWSENTGWINAEPRGDGGPGMHVASGYRGTAYRIDAFRCSLEVAVQQCGAWHRSVPTPINPNVRHSTQGLVSDHLPVSPPSKLSRKSSGDGGMAASAWPNWSLPSGLPWRPKYPW